MHSLFIENQSNIVLGFTWRHEKRYLETDALPCLNKFKLQIVKAQVRAKSRSSKD